ncbi:MAG: nuclear transport factor 2 family protein [Halieaceae bacterium]|jgi:ketosteroid isomerase-like protein|nr:nuclear transport factor 2 family protein [Halieaceae bacterium]
MTNTELCAELFRAFQSGDEERARSLCSDDLVARQNNNPPMDIDALLAMSRSVHGVVSDFRYEEVTRSETKTGFVEEHRVRGVLGDGSVIDVPVCVVGDVIDGKVASLREYLDLSAVAKLIATAA